MERLSRLAREPGLECLEHRVPQHGFIERLFNERHVKVRYQTLRTIISGGEDDGRTPLGELVRDAQARLPVPEVDIHQRDGAMTKLDITCSPVWKTWRAELVDRAGELRRELDGVTADMLIDRKAVDVGELLD